jgi:hypothetical protein
MQVQNPTGGGSYERDPKTGELVQREGTRQSLPRGWGWVDGQAVQVDEQGRPVPVDKDGHRIDPNNPPQE